MPRLGLRLLPRQVDADRDEPELPPVELVLGLRELDSSYQQPREAAWLRQRAADARVALRVNHTLGIASAVQAGAGIGALPCWLGDTTHDVERVLPTASYRQDLWIVMHRDLRRAARVRTVTDLLIAELTRAAPVLLGAHVQRTAR
jgi:DNA-binding transcriptional LysR family regulator